MAFGAAAFLAFIAFFIAGAAGAAACMAFFIATMLESVISVV